MKRELFMTGDGSYTLRIPDWDEQYHSKHGAIREAEHVFIKNGWEFFTQKIPDQNEIHILEIGWGTGLNTLLTLLFAQDHKQHVDYTGLEAYPVKEEEWKKLNYPELIDHPRAKSLYEKIHLAKWEEPMEITDWFKLTKNQLFFQDFDKKNQFDLVYFDAFGARVQPELWEKAIFKTMFEALKPNGVLVTYSSKGSVRRAMIDVGFKVEKLPGPPGKREMLRALKTKDLK